MNYKMTYVQRYNHCVYVRRYSIHMLINLEKCKKRKEKLNGQGHRRTKSKAEKEKKVKRKNEMKTISNLEREIINLPNM